MFGFITKRPLWVNILAGLVFAFIIFLLFILSLDWMTHHGKSKTVPQVLGKSYSEAEKILEDAGFAVEILDSIYVDTTKPLQVLRQVPDADEMVKVNRTVYLTINRAVPPLIEMPNIVGSSLRSAELTLKNYNLRVGDTTFRPDFAKNAVLEQSFNGTKIAPGTKIRMGSPIDLVLGDGVGDRQYLVPQLIGKTYCEAKSLIEASGISFGVVLPDPDVSDTCGAYIYWQNPNRLGDDKRYRYIRSGQLIDVKLQLERPVLDTIHTVDPSAAARPEDL
ncbi:MAG: PASTA domain-containing protein [Chitinophagaceae bacterium]|nr:PASTA domain-containing protein [Chitinophagaceae bacterium]